MKASIYAHNGIIYKENFKVEFNKNGTEILRIVDMNSKVILPFNNKTKLTKDEIKKLYDMYKTFNSICAIFITSNMPDVGGLLSGMTSFMNMTSMSLLAGNEDNIRQLLNKFDIVYATLSAVDGFDSLLKKANKYVNLTII